MNTIDTTIKVKNFIADKFHTTESIKTLRTNVVFSGEDIRSVGITSCYEGEGKTTISLNLAASLALAGKKTVLLDADLRKSVLAKFVGNAKRIYGLSQYLAGQCVFDDIIYETDIPNLFIVFSGARVVNSAELLGTQRMQNMIEILKEEFLYVIVDTAPLGRVIDCAVMAPVIDGMLIVVDSQKNSYKDVRSVKNQYEKANGKILGVVLNKCNLNEGRNSYRYGKYYGYGYGSISGDRKQREY